MTSKLIGCSLHIQPPASANLYRKCYTLLLNAAAFCLQPAVMHFDVFPNIKVEITLKIYRIPLSFCVKTSRKCEKEVALCKKVYVCVGGGDMDNSFFCFYISQLLNQIQVVMCYIFLFSSIFLIFSHFALPLKKL